MASSKHDMAADREGMSADRTGRLLGSRAVMDPHLTEVMSEARLEEVTASSIEWLSRRAQCPMHDRRGLGFGGLWPIRPFLKPLLLLARGALAADLLGRRIRGGHARRGRQHYLVGDAVSLMLQRIVNGADFKFRLNGTKEPRCQIGERRLKSARTVQRRISGFC